MEWNWDIAWWQKPRRIVKPARTTPEPERRAEPQTQPPPTAAAERNSKAEDSSGTAEGLRQTADRSYLQLYLLSTEPPPGTTRGESQYRLHAVSARTCAAVLEMLCVPVGRSGGSDESYLLYEDRGEFNAARELAAVIDVPRLSTPPHTIGPDEAFSAGVGLMFRVIEQGAIVEASLLEACLGRLTESLQSDKLDAEKRWAAGVLAGRVAADFKYDYPLAQSYYVQAERFFAVGTRENATAVFWMADAMMQEGKASDAAALFERIPVEYGAKVGKSALLGHVKSAMKGKKK